MSEIERVVDAVAADLAWISPEPVYVGGATIGLFLDALGRSQLRATLDVDCIVPSVVTRVAWWKLEEGLRARGWSPDPDGPICRYWSPGGVVVDLMSEDPGVLGFSGRWYPRVVERAERRTLVTGRSVLVAPPDLLLACKLDAWRDRGARDPYASKDLEDIVALLDGCRELEASVVGGDEDVREAIAVGLTEILEHERYRVAALGQLPRGGDADAQEARVLALARRLAGLTR